MLVLRFLAASVDSVRDAEHTAGFRRMARG